MSFRLKGEILIRLVFYYLVLKTSRRWFEVTRNLKVFSLRRRFGRQAEEFGIAEGRENLLTFGRVFYPKPKSWCMPGSLK